MDILVLTLLGLCFGSFVNALVWRVHVQSGSKSGKHKEKYSIARGRSMCPNCEHELAAKDLIPVFSWLLQEGKCRYCKKAISWQYPLVEIVAALLFVGSYIFWPYLIESWDYVAFASWLIVLVGLLALLVYDLRWMLLPNRILFPLYFVGFVYVVSRALSDRSIEVIRDGALGAIIGGGIFYILFQVSKGRWIGGGDVKIGFLLGALCGSGPLALLMLFIASLFGTLYSLPLMAMKQASRASKIPFGPFLIASTIVVVLFGQNIVDWYIEYFLWGY